MLTVIRTLAIATFKESIRDRILLSLVVFTLLLLGSTVFLGSISLDQDSKIIIDFGLFGIFFFGLLITLFVGANAIVKEIDQHSVYTVLTRPLKRSWFIVGKFFGLAATLCTLTLFMSLIFLVLLVVRLGWHAIDAALILALLYIFLEQLIVIALTLMFSSFSSNIMSTIYSLAVVLIGHSSTTIVLLMINSKSVAHYIFRGIYYLLPNLDKFNLRNDAVYHIHPEAVEVLLAFGYALLYCVIFLYLAQAALKKQEL